MHYTLTNPNPSDVFRLALGRLESGLYQNAGKMLLEILAQNPADADAHYYLTLIKRKLQPPRPKAKPTLIWQIDPAEAWETDWIRALLGDAVKKEVVDKTWSLISDPMIVVDNRLVPEKIPYYREAWEKGARIILIHLSDETYRDHAGAYAYCDAVFRNYHSTLRAEQASITFFPLGCKAGFVRTDYRPKLAAERRHLWSFAGDIKKMTRPAMMSAMAQLPNGFSHLTEGFNAVDCLSTDAYRAMLDETVIAPCPAGWSNLDSFRVYEALEAGCIPIVEKRPSFDYFTNLLGPNPIPAVFDWAEAPDLVRQWQSQGTLESLRTACLDWWEAYKPRLSRQLTDAMDRAIEATGLPGF